LKFREPRIHEGKAGVQRGTAVRTKVPGSRPKNPIQLAGVKSSVPPITETMWIVLERDGPSANHPVWQIEMWRVTILHVPAGNPTRQNPRKI